MTAVLLDALRHNTWATRELLVLCQGLPEGHLTSPGPAGYGDILATLNHIVGSEASYLARLAGEGPAWVRPGDRVDLGQLLARVVELEQSWERFLSGPFDPEHVHIVDDGLYEVRAGVILAQVLQHGNAHREQVCAILTSLGNEPPDIQPWEYAWVTQRIWERTAPTDPRP